MWNFHFGELENVLTVGVYAERTFQPEHVMKTVLYRNCSQRDTSIAVVGGTHLELVQAGN